MHILITGGTGLIGSQLVKRLQGVHEITVLTRKPARASKLFEPSIQLVEKLSAVDFNNVDVIVNLAGESIAGKRWTSAQKSELERSRWQITRELTDAINTAQMPPHTFISGSAVGYYGRQNNIPITENFDQCFDEFSHQLCHRWEAIALEAQSALTRVCLLRTGIVLSTQGGALPKMLPSFKMGLGGPIADGQQFMSWIHIEDMIGATMHIIADTSLSGPINATAPVPVSNEKFSLTLAHYLNRPCLFRVPKTVLKILLGEMSNLVIYGQNVIPDKLLAAGYKFKYAPLGAALENLLGTRR